MPVPIVPDGGAFRRSDERHKKADGTPSNFWMAYCRACEAAHKKYLEDVSACNGDRAAIANIAVFDDVRAYMEGLAADSGQGRKKRRAELKLDSLFSRELTASERAVLEKRALVLVADLRLSFSAVENSSF
ncbi:hypothetical protein I4F81_008892 [Pyropia yezoensis]|uniref:Uncharacterized protein n=1 Tax=Pyropia yezoensis TaxID=2788 RepID=A0ACC3C864_PYRYE|nr:hypothetical protein I4F81_008892 [Neopyropia yezoensis]